MDGYAASHRAVREMKPDGELLPDTKLRSSKYLNNLVEGGRERLEHLRVFPGLPGVIPWRRQ